MQKVCCTFSVLVCLCCTGAWAAAGSSQVFVSTGIGGKVYGLNTANGALTQLISSPGSDLEGMVVAPYNYGQLNTDETTHYLVYVCDPVHGTVSRFDPTAAAPSLETIYSKGVAGLTAPQCGRITSTGDLVVSSTAAGEGVWLFPAVTGLQLGSAGLRTPVQLSGVLGSGEGIAQKNTGDLLVVDSTNKQVLRTPLTASATSTPFITGLAQPFGIARRGDGAIFVSNQGNRANLVQFNAQGGSPTTCATFRNNNTPNFMQMALDNTLFVGVATNNGGSVLSLNANNCQQIQSFSMPSQQPAVGIALPPTMTASQNVAAQNGVAQVNFGFSAFVLNQIGSNTACSGSISVGLASPAVIDVLIGASDSSATPAVNLGLDGFEAMYSTLDLNGCVAGSAGSEMTNFNMSNFLSAGVNNPQIMVCTDPGVTTDCAPVTTSLSQIGGFPIGGYLPTDYTASASKSLRCRIFMVNATPVGGDPTQQSGFFCGFQSPVNNTFTGVLNAWDAALASSISAGKSVPVKFKLASSTGSCQNGPYVSNATAILSVAEILDNKGKNVFVPIGLISNGSSGLAQPLFKGDNNNQYMFNWDSSSCIMPNGVTQVCPKGTYSVTVLLLTNNTAGGEQSIYGAQTTLVKLK